MNLLTELLLRNPAARRAQNLELLQVVARELLPREYPLLPQNPAFESVYMPFLSSEAWSRNWQRAVARNGGPHDPRELGIARWVTALEFPDGVCLVPDDRRSPAGDVQLLTRIGGLRGRIRFTGPVVGGRLAAVSEALLEATLHCADGGCDADSDCETCCGECKCRVVMVGEGSLKGLACWCPHHSPR